MFENLLHQDAAVSIVSDLTSNTLPSSMLFAGDSASGKLTCALELARVFSCTGAHRGAWNCTCPACRKHKTLMHSDLLLCGFRSCTSEIAAAEKTLLEASSSQAPHLASSRYLFWRSVKKLTLRFSPILCSGDDKVSKFAPLIASIDEILEEINAAFNPHPSEGALEKLTAEIVSSCAKLDSAFMYDSLPVAHVRNAAAWARFTAAEGKKTLIIENAERMQESARNALLKILEEPPLDTVFILTSAKRSAMMPTILSRVRTYQFASRTNAEQTDVLSRVFHVSPAASSNIPSSTSAPDDVIEAYLRSFLPIDPLVVRDAGSHFLRSALLAPNGNLPDVRGAVQAANKFEPRVLLESFFDGFFTALREIRTEVSQDSASFARRSEREARCLEKIRECYSRITVYNQSPESALEILAADLSDCAAAFDDFGVSA